MLRLLAKHNSGNTYQVIRESIPKFRYEKRKLLHQKEYKCFLRGNK